MKDGSTIYYERGKAVPIKNISAKRAGHFIKVPILFILYVVITYLSYPIRMLASIITFLSIVDVGLCLLFFRNKEMIIGMIIMGLVAIAIKTSITALALFLGDQIGISN